MPFENPIKLIFVLMSGGVLDDDIFCACVKGCEDTKSALTQLSILLSKYLYGTSAKYLICKIQRYKLASRPPLLPAEAMIFIPFKTVAMQSLGRTQL